MLSSLGIFCGLKDSFIHKVASFLFEGENGLAVEQGEVKSENARNVILSYGEGVYYVNKVNVQVSEGAALMKAIFHARRVTDNQPEDINVEIKQNVYDMLVEYAKLDKLDMILVLHIEGTDAKWCLMSENWLKNQGSEALKTSYIV